MKNKDEKNISLLLRVGLAFTFIYAGITAYLSPSNWIGFIPLFIENFTSLETFLKFHSVFDILLGLWLLSNKKIFYASTLSAIFLTGIIIFNFASLDIIFRDIPILLAAIALAIMSKE